MQKSFALRARRVIKKVAALSIGVAMLGATMGGALAADPTLAGYPSPFTGSDAAIIIGNSADSAAAADIALGLPKAGTGSAIGAATGSISANLPLGMGIANSTATGFDWEISQSYVSSFRKGLVNFQSKDYNSHDELVLAKDTPNTATSLSSKSAVQTDYEDNVYLETAGRNKIGYYYVFDDSINVSKATTDKPLELKFLGKTLKITAVDSTDTNSGTFTAYITNQYFMNAGDSVTVNDKKVKLENVGSTGAILVSVDGVIDTVSSSNSKVINGIEVANDQTFYDANNKKERAATLFIGKNAQNTYKSGDAYVGEDRNAPNWIWDTSNLDNSTSTSVTQGTLGTLAITGPKIGILNNFISQSSSQNPPGVGNCLSLPNNYAGICLDSLTVASTDYLTVTVELDKNEDTTRCGAWGGSQNVIKISAPGDNRFKIVGNSLNGAIINATSDKKTNQIWIASVDGGVATSANNQFAVCYFDPNKNPTMQLAGYINITGILRVSNITNGTALDAQIALLDYGSTKNNNVNFTFGRGANSTSTNGNTSWILGIQQQAVTTNDIENGGDYIYINWTTNGAGLAGNFTSIGQTASTEEDGELLYGPSILGIGRKDVNLRTRYGTVIKDPKANGASDREVFAFPAAIVKAKTIIKGVAVSEPTSSSSSSNTMNADKVTDLTQYNAILVGGPCANSQTAKIMGASSAWPDCAKGFTAGEAVLNLKANGSKWALVVAGYSADDTRRAAIVLKSYSVDGAGKPFFLTGTSKTVKGTSLEVSGITVV